MGIIYIHRIEEHDLTHQFGLQKKQSTDLFELDSTKSYDGIRFENKGKVYLGKHLGATDPRLGGDFNEILRANRAQKGDFVVFRKTRVEPYLIAITKKKIPIGSQEYSLQFQVDVGDKRHFMLEFQDAEIPHGPKDPPSPQNPVDRLTIALKLFEEMRYEKDWQSLVNKESFLNAFYMASSLTSSEMSGWSIDDFYNNFLLKIWAFVNGGSRRYGQLNETAKQSYHDFVIGLKTELKSFDAYFPPDEKCPDGMGRGVLTELLMRFWPKSCCSYNKPLIHEGLVAVGLAEGEFVWPKTPSIYQEFMGKCAIILRRMEDMKFARTPVPGNKEAPDYLTVNEFLWFAHENKDLIKEKVMSATYKKTEIKKVTQSLIKNFSDFVKKLEDDVKSAGLKYADGLMKRFVCAQLAKPFVVLTGLSGSGKTKLAQAFTEWIAVRNTSLVVPVGADWTNSERLLGFPNALDESNYVLPDTGVLKFMLDAKDNPELPFFLILDEMNLSHVERYFADFLSAMESGDEIKLYDGKQRHAGDGTPVPQTLAFPKNLFVIGTMNVDETTYMFSPKVLDRAQVIEFRVSKADMSAFLGAPSNPKLSDLAGKGAEYAEAFLELAAARKTKQPEAAELAEVKKALDAFFPPLAELGAEFGYRTAIEIVTFVAYYFVVNPAINDAIDAAIVQKLLPKLHGSQARLGPVLKKLKELASDKKKKAQEDGSEKEVYEPRYKLTCDKLSRMQARLKANGFTSFAEA